MTSRSDVTSIAELLGMFRAIEDNSDAITVLGDEDAMKVLSSWSKTDQTWRAPKKKQPAFALNRHGEAWRWIVTGWSFDEAAIATGSGLTARTVRAKLDMLVAARLIYPDGEMSKAARAALQVHIASKLGIKAKRQPPTEPAPSGGKGGN